MNNLTNRQRRILQLLGSKWIGLDVHQVAAAVGSQVGDAKGDLLVLERRGLAEWMTVDDTALWFVADTARGRSTDASR